MDKREAIVVGAGPSGLACALALSSACTKVYLVERYPSFEKRGATFGMARNGQLALEEICPELLERMKQIGLTAGPTGTLVFVWWEMRDAILEFVRKKNNVVLHCGEEFTSIEDGEDGVTVAFESGLELRADFVVGADGVHSKVRNDVLGLAPSIASPNTLFRGSLQVPDTASDELKRLLEKGMVPLAVDNAGGKVYFVLFNFHQRHPGRLAWILSTNIDIANEEMKATPFDLVNEYVADEKDRSFITEILSLSDEAHLEPYPKTSIADLSDETLETYKDKGWGGRGRITLIGDAAHAMRPTDGYGGSMAMEDAVVLSRILKAHSKQGVPIQDLLRRYEAERLPRVKRVYDNQNDRYDTRMKEGKRPGPQSKEFTDWLLAGV